MRIVFFGDSLTSGTPGSSFFEILREDLPGHILINQGRGNDTVVSLYRRMSHLRFDGQLDLAFLWIGVNDLAIRTTWLYRSLTALAGQRRARDLDEFRTYYQSSLDLLRRHAVKVIAVSPVLRGEDIHSPWNHQLNALSSAIQELSASSDRVEFLDLRSVFMQRLEGRPVSDYVPRSAIHVVLDAATLRNNDQIDGRAAERGLHLTLDGLHLNSAGAQIVASQFMRVIREGL